MTQSSINSRESVMQFVKYACVGVLNTIVTLCYGLQLLVVWLLSYKTPLKHFELDIAAFTLSGYGLATLLGNVVYTLVNYIYNKIITFRS